MANADTIINNFAARVRQLIIRVESLKGENGELKNEVAKRDDEIRMLKEQLQTQKEQYNALMMAKMISITDDDIEVSRRRITMLIRSVNRCISLVSGRENANNG